MKRLTRSWILPVVLVSLSLFVLACGGAASQPTAVSPTAPPEQGRPTQAVQPTVASRPTSAPPQPTAAATQPQAGPLPDLDGQAELLAKLPGYHFEGVIRVNEAGSDPVYLQAIQDIDADGNYHMMVYDTEGGAPTLDLYYVDKHTYLGQQGTYLDLGEQGSEQVASLTQVYMLPFQTFFMSIADMRPVGQETVNGLATTKYSGDFNQVLAAYVKNKEGVTYSASGFLWVANDSGVIVKSETQAAWTEGAQQSTFEARSEISQVGQVERLVVPR